MPLRDVKVFTPFWGEGGLATGAVSYDVVLYAVSTFDLLISVLR